MVRTWNVVKVGLTCENLDIQPYVHVQPIGTCTINTYMYNQYVSYPFELNGLNYLVHISILE